MAFTLPQRPLIWLLYTYPAALLARDPAYRPQGCDHVLMATGRKPNTEDLGLEQVRAGPAPTHPDQARACLADGTWQLPYPAVQKNSRRLCLSPSAPWPGPPAGSSHGWQARPHLPPGRAVGCMHTGAGSLKALTWGR